MHHSPDRVVHLVVDEAVRAPRGEQLLEPVDRLGADRTVMASSIHVPLRGKLKYQFLSHFFIENILTSTSYT